MEDYIIPLGFGLVIIAIVAACIYDHKERPAKIAAAEVLLDETPYTVHLLHDKGSGKTLRCLLYDRSLIILPDAKCEK